MRDVRIPMAHFPRNAHIHRPQGQPRRGPDNGRHHQPRRLDQHPERIPLGPEYAPQVRARNLRRFPRRVLTHPSSVFERHHRFIGW